MDCQTLGHVTRRHADATKRGGSGVIGMAFKLGRQEKGQLSGLGLAATCLHICRECTRNTSSPRKAKPPTRRNRASPEQIVVIGDTTGLAVGAICYKIRS